MRLKQLRGLPVIDPTAARKIGTVTDYQVNPATGCLAALDITAVDDNQDAGILAQRILAQRIRRVGQSAVILIARGGASANVAADVNARWLDGSTLVGLEVMGDDGNRIEQAARRRLRPGHAGGSRRTFCAPVSGNDCCRAAAASRLRKSTRAAAS